MLAHQLHLRPIQSADSQTSAWRGPYVFVWMTTAHEIRSESDGVPTGSIDVTHGPEPPSSRISVVVHRCQPSLRVTAKLNSLRGDIGSRVSGTHEPMPTALAGESREARYS